jgi:hypothetical protein
MERTLRFEAYNDYTNNVLMLCGSGVADMNNFVWEKDFRRIKA